MSKTTPILIKQSNTHKPTPAQRKFNTTMKRISQQREYLAQWQELLPRYRQEFFEAMQPLEQALIENQEQFVRCLDEAYKTQKLTKKQQEKITHLIVLISEQMIENYQRDEFKVLYNFYTNGDYDQEESEAKAEYYAQVKVSLKERLGIEIDPEQIDAETMADIQERFAAKQEEERAAQATKQAKRKKSAKQLAKAEREQQEAQELGKSIQTIYRQLVGALHPDREPDETERLRKTELMQQATVAYENKDLLKLLELQLALEQIDQEQINNLAEERLKYFNKILQDQLIELEQQVFRYQDEAAELTQVGMVYNLLPNHLAALVKRNLQDFKSTLKQLEMDLFAIQEPKGLKAWLNAYQIPAPATYFEFEF